MALKTFVKVGNITNLSDARYCAGMGVDQLGFNIHPEHPSFTKQEDLESIKSWVSGVEIIAEGELPQQADIFDGVQQEYSDFKGYNELPLVLSTTLQELKNIKEVPPHLNYFLLEGESDTLSADEISEIKTLASRYKIVLGYGFSVTNLMDILDQTGITGIAMKGTNEIRPGFKDYDELADILELLEDDPWD